MISKPERKRVIENNMRRVEARTARLETRAERISWLRLGLFVASFVAAGAAYFGAGPVAMWTVLLFFVIAFWAAVVLHRVVERWIERYHSWLDWQQRQLARMTLDWGKLKLSELSLPNAHPFAHDLDIVGEHSLLRLIDTAVTSEGRARLLEWLTTEESDAAETQTRQTLVMELAPRHRLRMKVAVEALQNRGARGWTPAQLRDALQPGTAERVLWIWAAGAALFAWVNLALLAMTLAGRLPPYWVGGIALYALLLFAAQRVVGDLFNDALTLEGALRPLSALFTLLERWRYTCTPALEELCRPFLDAHKQPSRIVARVMRVVNLTGVRGNPMMWLLLNLALPYDFLLAIGFNRVRREVAGLLPDWLERWFTLEALASLANLGYLNPHYAYPVLHGEGTAGSSIAAAPVVPGGNGSGGGIPGDQRDAPLVARALGHPLFADGQKVSNDFTVRELGTVAIVTGSNMSGKSSFLKAIGVNLALAYAGAPVDAASLELIPMRLFASMRISDSVTDGISFFYAEVKRLKALLDALEEPARAPLFFLIDEIFRGTNNRERLIGARAYTRALVGKRGTGLISTHDLELTRLADESGAISNFHFRETVEEGRMHFDYTLRTGPCPTTNALRIMELEGLPVQAAAAPETVGAAPP